MVKSTDKNHAEADKAAASGNMMPKTSFFGAVKTMALVSWQGYRSAWFWIVLAAACAVSGLAWTVIHLDRGTDAATPGQLSDQLTLINFIIIPVMAVLIARNLRRSAAGRKARALLSEFKSVRVWALAGALAVGIFLMMFGVAYLFSAVDHTAARLVTAVIVLILVTNLLGAVVRLAGPRDQLSNIGVLGALKPRVGLAILSAVIVLIWMILTLIAVKAIPGPRFIDGAITALIAGLMMVPVLSLMAACFLGPDRSDWWHSHDEEAAEKQGAEPLEGTGLIRRMPRSVWIGAGAVGALALAFYAGSIVNSPEGASKPRARMSDERMAAEAEAIRAYEQRAAVEKKIKTARALFKAEQYREAYTMALGPAKAGHAEAQFLLFELGWNPADHERTDPGDAKDLFGDRKAAAMTKVLELTKAASIEWLRKAADQGHVKANSKLGYQYYYGSSVLPKDSVQAVKHTRFAAENGDSGAQNNLGYFYGNGVGVAKNASLAFKWFKEAADNGDRGAASATGDNYSYGIGVSKNERLAYDYYLKAARKGDAKSQWLVGWYNIEGQVVPQNYRAAFDWTSKAAAQRHPTAITNLGYLYEKGYGVRQDTNKALELYLTAASLDDAQGANNAANMLWNKHKFDPRASKAIRSLFEKAHKLGHKDAARDLADYNRGARIVSGIMSWGARVGAAYFSGDAKELDKIADEQFRFLDQLVAPKKEE